MPCLSFKFRSDAELENLIVAIWIELERSQTPSPKLRLGGDEHGWQCLELIFGSDEHVESMKKMQDFPISFKRSSSGLLVGSAKNGRRGTRRSNGQKSVFLMETA